MAQLAHTSNVADYRVTLGDVDLTAKLRPLLVSLSLTEKRGDEADQLTIVLDDSSGKVALPATGAGLHIQLGWLRGSDVQPGLVDKGRFVVDEVAHEGPPDIITIRAHAADFTAATRVRREHHWRDTTLGTIVADLAARLKLKPRCSAALARVAIAYLAQSREGDLALLRRLGREHDAIATVKNGLLIFAAIGAGATAAGTPLPPATFHRRDRDRHSYSVERREEATGVTASWHDRKGAKKQDVTVGDGAKTRKLSKVYATEAAARTAAQAAMGRTARQPRKLTLEPALGRPDLCPDTRLTVTGFKAEIDAITWLVAEVTHGLGDRGLTTSVQLEAV